VRGIGSLPLLPRDLNPTLAHDIEFKLSLSLFLPFVPLPSVASGAHAFLSAVVIVPTVGGPLCAFVGMVKVGRGPISALGACLIGKAAALLM